MTDPEEASPAVPSEEADLIGPRPARPPTTGRAGRHPWLWSLLALVVSAPLLLTLAGALTSPPRARSVPVGHLIYMEADEPSDHTSILRGLRVMGPDGASRQLLHETEPQDRDAGSREWITQPQASPDGHWLTFEKQIITLQEEQQGVVNQLWVLSLDAPSPQPRLLLDLTQRHLKQFVGLAWTPDSRRVGFRNDDRQYLVSLADGTLAQRPAPRLHVGATLSPDGALEASAAPGSPFITVRPAHDPGSVARQIKARWGWSVWGGRHISVLKWSPDSKYLAYSVRKPPFEDELFYTDLATGKCYQLPVRTGAAGWDWTR